MPRLARPVEPAARVAPKSGKARKLLATDSLAPAPLSLVRAGIDFPSPSILRLVRPPADLKAVSLRERVSSIYRLEVFLFRAYRDFLAVRKRRPHLACNRYSISDALQKLLNPLLVTGWSAKPGPISTEPFHHPYLLGPDAGCALEELRLRQLAALHPKVLRLTHKLGGCPRPQVGADRIPLRYVLLLRRGRKLASGRGTKGC